MTFYYDTFPTPAGDFSAAVDENGALAATAFGAKDALLARITGAGKTGGAKNTPALTRAPARLVTARKQVDEYFAGKRRAFDLPLAPRGTPRQRRVWAALAAIPFGGTRSYGEIAKKLGSSPRAVGRANATNPIALIVPCHRVIGADGSLTGYAFGADIKRRLLAHERARAA